MRTCPEGTTEIPLPTSGDPADAELELSGVGPSFDAGAVVDFEILNLFVGRNQTVSYIKHALSFRLQA